MEKKEISTVTTISSVSGATKFLGMSGAEMVQIPYAAIPDATTKERGFMSAADKSKIDRSLPMTKYLASNTEKSVLIKTDIPIGADAMFYLKIIGNSYMNIFPYDITIQGYSYVVQNSIIYCGGISLIHDIPVKAFIYEGFLCFHMQDIKSFNSFIVSCHMTNSGDNVAINRVTDITLQAMPTSGVTRLVTINPKVIG